MDIKKIYDTYEREIKKDIKDVEIDKIRFIKEIKSGLGDKIKNPDTYKKPRLTLWGKIKLKLGKVLKYL